jgi:hypothetical protein
MSFLDELIADEKYSPNVAPELFTQIEGMIWKSSLDEKKKSRMTKRMEKLQNNTEAFVMIEELRECQPIIGLEQIPIAQYEIVEATRRRVEIENFKERGK